MTLFLSFPTPHLFQHVKRARKCNPNEGDYRSFQLGRAEGLMNVKAKRGHHYVRHFQRRRDVSLLGNNTSTKLSHYNNPSKCKKATLTTVYLEVPFLSYTAQKLFSVCHKTDSPWCSQHQYWQRSFVCWPVESQFAQATSKSLKYRMLFRRISL